MRERGREREREREHFAAVDDPNISIALGCCAGALQVTGWTDGLGF
jgi:hypothetical protein